LIRLQLFGKGCCLAILRFDPPTPDFARWCISRHVFESTTHHKGELILTDYRVGKGEAQEDQVTAAIEKVTSQLPSSTFLGLALASMGVSLGLHFSGRKHEALFVGQWAAPFLLLGLYNKLVKQHGSDAYPVMDGESQA
jgi:hypothetical protein